jgi:hypothetical protein
MMRGLYDIEVRPGTFQELALVFREVRDKENEYRSAVLSTGQVEEPEDLIEELRDQLLPGRAEDQEATKEKKGQYIRGLKDVDWSEHLSLDENVVEHRENQKKMEEELGPVVSN